MRVIETEIEQTEASLDAGEIRDGFPMLETRIHSKPIVYLGNAVSSLKPRATIDRPEHPYSSEFANTSWLKTLRSSTRKEFCRVREEITCRAADPAASRDNRA